MERWSQVGTPTRKARYAQVEALLDLKMLDRAWTRLKAIPAEHDDPLERARLTARMFLTRGWHERALEAVDDALDVYPQDAELRSLRTRAQAPAPPTPKPPPADAPFAERLAAAEDLLVAGAYLKARRLLEALDRQEPANVRVSDLLWALEGDHDLQGTSLAAVVRHAGSDFDDDVIAFDEGPPTDASVDLPSLAADDAAPFPPLFQGAQIDDDVLLGDAEDTQTMALASLLDPDTPPMYDDHEDTQIMHVVSDLVHDDTDDEADAEQTGTRELEEEDDVVVLLRRQDDQPPPQTRRPFGASRHPPRARRVGTSTPVADAEVELGLDEIDVVDVEPLEEAPAAASAPSTPAPPAPTFPVVWILVAAGVLGLGGLLVMITMAWLLLAG